MMLAKLIPGKKLLREEYTVPVANCFFYVLMPGKQTLETFVLIPGELTLGELLPVNARQTNTGNFCVNTR